PRAPAAGCAILDQGVTLSRLEAADARVARVPRRHEGARVDRSPGRPGLAERLQPDASPRRLSLWRHQYSALGWGGSPQCIQPPGRHVHFGRSRAGRSAAAAGAASWCSAAARPRRKLAGHRLTEYQPRESGMTRAVTSNAFWRALLVALLLAAGT